LFQANYIHLEKSKSEKKKKRKKCALHSEWARKEIVEKGNVIAAQRWKDCLGFSFSSKPNLD
jgi:hypothetical protein